MGRRPYLSVYKRGENLFSSEDAKTSEGIETITLGRGDRLILYRVFVGNSKQQLSNTLAEILETGTITSHLLESFNYDRDAAAQFLQQNKISLEQGLRQTWDSGFFGIPTSFAFGKQSPLQEIRMFAEPEYRAAFRFVIPAEALVKLETYDGYHLRKIPEHVRESPAGFAFIAPNSPENEITFSDLIPREWVDQKRLDAVRHALEK